MDEYDIYYYIGNLDYKLIPKNGCSSLRFIITYLDDSKSVEHLLDSSPSSGYHMEWQKRWQSIAGLYRGPRRNLGPSFAIKRDPVDRYVSAYDDVVRHRKLKFDWNDKHFRTQTSRAGVLDIYDHVFDLNEMNQVYDFIQEELKKNIPHVHIRKNPHQDKTTLTTGQEAYIMKKYKEDYTNGWF